APASLPRTAVTIGGTGRRRPRRRSSSRRAGSSRNHPAAAPPPPMTMTFGSKAFTRLARPTPSHLPARWNTSAAKASPPAATPAPPAGPLDPRGGEAAPGVRPLGDQRSGDPGGVVPRQLHENGVRGTGDTLPGHPADGAAGGQGFQAPPFPTAALGTSV